MTIFFASVILQTSKAVFSVINNTNALFENKSKEQLEIAYHYLNNSSTNENLIRMALQHMEST